LQRRLSETCAHCRIGSACCALDRQQSTIDHSSMAPGIDHPYSRAEDSSARTRGGLLCSDTFDHTLLLRSAESRFGPEAVVNLGIQAMSTSRGPLPIH
jgi:hypothetical protein